MFLLAVLAILVLLFVVLPLIGMAVWVVITTIFVGLILGALARLILPGRQAISMAATIVCGICGSVIGGFIGEHVGARWFGTLILEIVVALIGVAIAERRRAQVRA